MKRPADDTTTSPSQPSRKRVATHFEHYKMGSIYSLVCMILSVAISLWAHVYSVVDFRAGAALALCCGSGLGKLGLRHRSTATLWVEL